MLLLYLFLAIFQAVIIPTVKAIGTNKDIKFVTNVSKNPPTKGRLFRNTVDMLNTKTDTKNDTVSFFLMFVNPIIAPIIATIIQMFGKLATCVKTAPNNATNTPMKNNSRVIPISIFCCTSIGQALLGYTLSNA